MNFFENRGGHGPAVRAPAAGAVKVSLAEPPAEAVRLTTDGRFKRDPVFWSDGKDVIYAGLTPVTDMSVQRNGKEGHARLMRMRWDDRAVSPFHAKLTRSDKKGIAGRELCVSADGSSYAYRWAKNPYLFLAIVVENRKLQRTVTIQNAGTRSFLNRPTLSPDGRRIVFMRDNNRLVALDLWRDNTALYRDDAKEIVELGVEGDVRPNFSPDGRRIVFSSRRDRDYEIYAMNADGSEQRRLTVSRGIDTNPVFSPDSRRIAFTSNRDGNYEIYVMDADGRNQRRLTRSSERSDFPCWHPDGKHVVFVGERNGRFDLYMMDV